jgi:hypothetical protein
MWRCDWRRDDRLGTANLPLLRRSGLAIRADCFIASIAFPAPQRAPARPAHLATSCRRPARAHQPPHGRLWPNRSEGCPRRPPCSPAGPDAHPQSGGARGSPPLSAGPGARATGQVRPSVSVQALPSSRVDASSSSSAKTSRPSISLQVAACGWRVRSASSQCAHASACPLRLPG